MRMRVFVFGLTCWVVSFAPVHAQLAIKITTCGTAAPPSGLSNLYMDATGLLCTSGSGGGGGGSVTQGTTPWVDDITQWANVALGAPSNYGTSPGAVVVPGVNAAVTQSALPTGAGTAANQALILSAIQAPWPAGTNIGGRVGIDETTDGTTNGVRLTNGYPAGATAITASATGTTAATTATLAGTSGKTTYICSYSVRANATAAATVTDTLTGVITATMSSALWVAPLASGLGVDEQIFTPCVPASGTNVGIAVVSGAPGSGGTVSVHAAGYQQ